MTKITRQLLLQKGLPRCTKLDEIKRINLSRLQLRTEDLDPGLFSQMKKLEELDLSENLLSEIPQNLLLPSLRLLKCASNQLEDVTSLQQFQKLEELSYEDNLYLTISDNYKMMFLLPNLRRLNGKDVTSTANHVRFVNSRELTSRVTAHWQKNYMDNLLKSSSPDAIKSAGKDFVKSAVSQVKYGPSSLSDYTKWRVNMIATEFIASMLNPEKKVSSDLEGEGDDVRDDVSEASSTAEDKHESEAEGSTRTVIHSPEKRKVASCIDLDESPSKKKRPLSIDNLKSVAVSPRHCSRFPDGPRNTLEAQCRLIPDRKSEQLTPKRKAQNSIQRPQKTTPTKEVPPATRGVSGQGEAAKATHRKEPCPRQTHTNGTKVAPTKTAADATLPVSRGKSREAVALQPLHFLQCHSKDNNPGDFRTQLWACSFEPPLDHGPGKDSGSKTSQAVATCGGDSACVIDCETGRVLKKYKITGEELFSVAWTTLTMVTSEGQKRKFNVLAVAGRRGIVKLIHSRANFCYGEVKAHKKPISTICFSPKQETFLFTGSYDGRIILWDIGVPDCDYHFRVSQLLVLEANSTPLRLAPVPSSPDRYLLAACEAGCFAWDINLHKQQGRRPVDLEVEFPVYQKENDETDFRLVDGLCFLNSDIVASKSCMQSSIYLWSWSRTFESRQKKHKKKVDAVIVAELQWSGTELPYIQIACCSDVDCVLCGDETGAVWMYELGRCPQDRVSSNRIIPPTQILKWPAVKVKGQGEMSGTVINSLCADPKLNYLVTLTDKNIIVVWKRA